MVPSLLCTFVAHIIFLHVFFLSPFHSLSLSPLFLSIYVSLWLQDTCHMMPFTKQHSAYAWVVTCILFLINLTFHNLPLHSSYKIHQPITDYFLRLPYSELLEKRLFRSRANRRLVLDGVKEDRFHPGRNCRVRIGGFSAKVVCPKGWKVALLWIFVIRPIGRTNLTLQKDQLSGTEGSSMTKCPCVAMLTAKRSRHGEAADGW